MSHARTVPTTMRSMPEPELRLLPVREDAGLGTLRTERGNLPLESLALTARITGLIGHSELVQGFQNPYDEPLEATYVFPLPDRAAVTGMRMAAADRVVEAQLAERAQAREEYERAVAAGRRAAIAEEERPDVFTMRVGNILPGEQVTVTLTLAGPLSYEDGEATYRFPLVVAPRYIPGEALPGDPVGDGYAPDTDAVPDASRITPPVLLPGFPNPVRLSIEVDLDPGGLPLTEARSSLPVAATETGWRVEPGQRADRDFLLRLRYGDPVHPSHALVLSPDADGDEGTLQLTVLPPTGTAPPRPRDLVLVLDRSGSMSGWKIAAARRAAARIVDTLTGADRFAVLTFDNVVERPPGLTGGLVAGDDQHRFQAVAHLGSMTARGGTELLAPLREALSLLDDSTGERDRVLVLVTDGQVGNEDQILRETAAARSGVRCHTIGIDKAVNAGFLGRLAAGGRCELVESEDRLDEAAQRIHRRIGAPLVTGVSCHPKGLDLLPDTLAPARAPDLFPGAPLVLTARYRGRTGGSVEVRGTAAGGTAWSAKVDSTTVETAALAAVWARAHLRELEDKYVSATGDAASKDLERRIVATSLRFSVLCRFTAYVAVDPRTVTDGATPHRVVQPVELPAGWQPSSWAAAAVRPAAVGYTAPESATMDTMPAAGAFPRVRPQSGTLRRSRSESQTQVPAPLPVAVLAGAAARLREAAGLPDSDRRVLLADLASRLDAVLRNHRDTAFDPTTAAALAELRRLLAELLGDAALRLDAGAFAQAWQRLRELLDRLTTGAATPEPAPPPTRRAFWKRA